MFGRASLRADMDLRDTVNALVFQRPAVDLDVFKPRSLQRVIGKGFPNLADTSHGRTSGYFVSEHEYAEYTRLKARAVKAYDVAELPDNLVAALKTVKMDSRHDHLNDLLDDKG